MTPTWGLQIACGAVLASVSLASAQPVSVPASALTTRDAAPAGLEASLLTLAEAARLTLMHSPVLAEATEALAIASGQYRQTQGLFDARVLLGPAIEYRRTPLHPAVSRLELARRDAWRGLAQAFGPLAAQFGELARTLDGPLPQCPRGVLDSLDRVSALSATASRAVASTGRPRPPGLELGDAGLRSASATITGLNLCGRATDLDPVDQLAAWYRALAAISHIDQGFGLPAQLEPIGRVPRELYALKAQASELVAAQAALGVSVLGGAPVDEVERHLGVDAEYSRPFRNGVRVSGRLQARSVEYRGDDAVDPAFGGLGASTRVPVAAVASADVPLGRGRGATSVAAPERAARLGLDATREQLRHLASREVYRTVLAYVATAGAQATVELLEQSAARQAELADLVEQLIAVGDVAAMERGRMQARVADVNGALSEARARSWTTRVGLAESIGLDVSALEALPLASDDVLDGRPIVGQVDDLAARALDRRRDRSALVRLREATAALDAGAHADLRRAFTLSVSGGVESIDERHSFILGRAPVRFYDTRGFGRAFSGRWLPFLQVAFTVDVPFANSAARGRAAVSRADLRSRDVERRDLDRSIHEGVVGAASAASSVRSALERVEDAVRFGEQVLADALELFRAGELTLIDTLRTEEQLTVDRLELVRLQQAYLGLIARLRFETGELVPVTGEGTDLESWSFDPAVVTAR